MTLPRQRSMTTIDNGAGEGSASTLAYATLAYAEVRGFESVAI